MSNSNRYTLTLFETCEKLGKSPRTVSRYIRKGKLNPISIKSRNGTLEYRFDPAEVDALKEEDRLFGPDRQDKTTPEKPEQPDPKLIIPEDDRQDEKDRNDSQDKTSQTELQDQPITLAEQDKNAGQDKQDKAEMKDKTSQAKTGETGQEAIIGLLQKTVNTLEGQLTAKDNQINELIERNREVNILLKTEKDAYKELQNRMFALKPGGEEEAGKPKSEQPQGTAANERSASKAKAKRQKTQNKKNNPSQEAKTSPAKKDEPKKGFWQKLFS
jgi:hypothetical protein